MTNPSGENSPPPASGSLPKPFMALRWLLGLVMLISIFLPIRVLMSVGEAALAFKQTLGAQPLPVFTAFVVENRPVFIALPFVLTAIGLGIFVINKQIEKALLLAAAVVAMNSALAFAIGYAVSAPLSRIMEMSQKGRPG